MLIAPRIRLVGETLRIHSNRDDSAITLYKPPRNRLISEPSRIYGNPSASSSSASLTPLPEITAGG